MSNYSLLVRNKWAGCLAAAALASGVYAYFSNRVEVLKKGDFQFSGFRNEHRGGKNWSTRLSLELPRKISPKDVTVSITSPSGHKFKVGSLDEYANDNLDIQMPAGFPPKLPYVDVTASGKGLRESKWRVRSLPQGGSFFDESIRPVGKPFAVTASAWRGESNRNHEVHEANITVSGDFSSGINWELESYFVPSWNGGTTERTAAMLPIENGKSVTTHQRIASPFGDFSDIYLVQGVVRGYKTVTEQIDLGIRPLHHFHEGLQFDDTRPIHLKTKSGFEFTLDGSKVSANIFGPNTDTLALNTVIEWNSLTKGFNQSVSNREDVVIEFRLIEKGVPNQQELRENYQPSRRLNLLVPKLRSLTPHYTLEVRRRLIVRQFPYKLTVPLKGQAHPSRDKDAPHSAVYVSS